MWVLSHTYHLTSTQACVGPVVIEFAQLWCLTGRSPKLALRQHVLFRDFV